MRTKEQIKAAVEHTLKGQPRPYEDGTVAQGPIAYPAGVPAESITITESNPDGGDDIVNVVSWPSAAKIEKALRANLEQPS